jgi:hypothetical protein
MFILHPDESITAHEIFAHIVYMSISSRVLRVPCECYVIFSFTKHREFWRTGSIRDDSYWTSREKSLELIELSSINKVSLVWVSSCINTGSIRDDPYWTSSENSSELIELSSINKVSLVQVSSCNTGSIRDDPYWTSRKSSLELIELSRDRV